MDELAYIIRILELENVARENILEVIPKNASNFLSNELKIKIWSSFFCNNSNALQPHNMRSNKFKEAIENARYMI